MLKGEKKLTYKEFFEYLDLSGYRKLRLDDNHFYYIDNRYRRNKKYIDVFFENKLFYFQFWKKNCCSFRFISSLEKEADSEVLKQVLEGF